LASELLIFEFRRENPSHAMIDARPLRTQPVDGETVKTVSASACDSTSLKRGVNEIRASSRRILSRARRARSHYEFWSLELLKSQSAMRVDSKAVDLVIV
jgi:hypothetical protein